MNMIQAAIALETAHLQCEDVPDIVLRVAERLRAGFSEIPTQSTSYPYLALARRRGIDYGAVLHYVDVIGNMTDFEPQVVVATALLTASDRCAILYEYELEMARRADRLNEENARAAGR